MKSLVVTDSISRAAGGLFEAERRMHQELFSAGVDVAVFSLDDQFVSADSPVWQPIVPRTFPVRLPEALGRSPEQHRALMAEQGDVLYRAGLWRWSSQSAHSWSRLHRKPEIIAPHGMLDPWAVRNSAWKKRVVRWLFEDAHLRDASCLRALCQSEADAMRAFGLKNPIAIIPNGIDLPDESREQKVENRNEFQLSAFPISAFTQNRKVLLYLGRLHPKKGLVNLLKAWASCHSSPVTRHSDWTLALAGWDQGGHESELKQLATELGIAWSDIRNTETPASDLRPPTSVLFLGPLFGAEKAAAYANCDAFVLPSFSEGLPMAVLEAWAYGKPVLMTPECNLPEGFSANAALQIETNPDSIKSGLTDLFRAPNSALRTLGGNGRRLVAEKFTWPKIAANMKSVYEWAIGGGTKPDCVVG